MVKFITSKQQHILDFLYAYVEKHGYSPTQYEIAETLNMSRSLVKDYLYKLEQKDWITTPGRKYRNIKLKGKRNV